MINKLIKLALKKHDPPEHADDASMVFVSGPCEGLHYYIKLTPCKNNTLYPEIGTMTEEEFIAFDKKRFEEKAKAMQRAMEETMAADEILDVKQLIDPNLTCDKDKLN